MNRTNKTSDFRRSGVKAGVRALPEHCAPYIRGGMGHKSAGGCSTAIFLTLLYHRRLPATTRPDRADTGEKGKTEATPPLFAASAANRAGVWGRGCYRVWGTPCPPLWGSLPSKLSLREGGRSHQEADGGSATHRQRLDSFWGFHRNLKSLRFRLNWPKLALQSIMKSRMQTLSAKDAKYGFGRLINLAGRPSGRLILGRNCAESRDESEKRRLPARRLSGSDVPTMVLAGRDGFRPAGNGLDSRCPAGVDMRHGRGEKTASPAAC